jgi:hypothetical protein
MDVVKRQNREETIPLVPHTYYLNKLICAGQVDNTMVKTEIWSVQNHFRIYIPSTFHVSTAKSCGTLQLFFLRTAVPGDGAWFGTALNCNFMEELINGGHSRMKCLALIWITCTEVLLGYWANTKYKQNTFGNYKEKGERKKL